MASQVIIYLKSLLLTPHHCGPGTETLESVLFIYLPSSLKYIYIPLQNI